MATTVTEYFSFTCIGCGESCLLVGKDVFDKHRNEVLEKVKSGELTVEEHNAEIARRKAMRKMRQ